MTGFSDAFGPDFGPLNPPPDDLLPRNRTPYQRALSLASHRMLLTDTDVIRRSRAAFDAPDALLPFLAAERSVHHYKGGVYDRRRRTDDSFTDHLSYGTPDALETEIALDAGEPRENIRIKEFWTERDLAFPDFVVETLRNPGDPLPDLRPTLRAARLRKNVRDWLSSVRTHYRHPPGALYYGACANVSIRVRTVTPKSPNLRYGAAMRALITQRTVV